MAVFLSWLQLTSGFGSYLFLHGRAAGPRSYVERFDRFVSDVDKMLQNAAVRNAALSRA